MDSWKKHALVSLENELKVNLSMTDLVGRLERPAGGFMTELERKHVEEVQGGSERVGRILGILRGKGNKEFDTFLKMLKESGNEVWADKIQESAQLFEECQKSKDHSGLRAIEHHMEGGSDMSLQLTQGGQVQGEGGSGVVCVPVTALKRKQSRSFASSVDTPCCPAEKKTMDEYMKMRMDLEKQDLKCVHAKSDRAIRLFYANALSRIIRLLEPHLDALKMAANIYLQLGLHEGQVERSDVESAESVSTLLGRMSIEAKWGNTCFLQQAVDAIPTKAREVAQTILSHYNLHLAIYEKATLLKDDIAKKKESENKDEGRQVVAESQLVPMEITSSKSLTEFTCKDCHHLQVRILSQTFGIPAEKINCLEAVEHQSGLKAIEYSMEEGSDMSLQLTQGGQVQGEGRSGVVCVPVTVLKRKRSRSSANSVDTPCCPAEKKTMDEYMKIRMDLERQDMKCVHAKSDQAIRLLYDNALSRIIRLLEPHLDALKRAVNIYLQLGLHKEQVKRSDVESAVSVSTLFRRMSIEWGNTCFLQQAVDAIPSTALEREVAEAILSHYNLHLAIYEKATLLKDDIIKKKESENKDEGRQVAAESELVPLKITSSKSLTEFTSEDCHHLQVRILSQTFGIPAEKISCLEAVERKSTTVTFCIPNGFTYVIMQRSMQLKTIWILLELDVIEVAIRGFTFKPSVDCFLTLLRESKPFSADLLGVTEILPYQMYCLVDPGTKEPLSGCPLGTRRIAQHLKLHDAHSDNAGAEANLLDAGQESVDEQPLIESVEGEEEIKSEGKESVVDSIQLPSRVQELEDKLKKCELTMEELIHDNTALQLKLKASQMEEGRACQEMV